MLNLQGARGGAGDPNRNSDVQAKPRTQTPPRRCRVRNVKPMECNEARRLLEAHVDGELELTGQLDLETHLAGCTECKKAAETATKFRNSMHMNMPVYKAPPELKAKVQAVLRKASKSETRLISALRRPLLAAAVLLVC